MDSRRSKRQGLTPPWMQSGPVAKVQPPSQPTPMPTLNQPPSALAETQFLAIIHMVMPMVSNTGLFNYRLSMMHEDCLFDQIDATHHHTHCITLSYNTPIIPQESQHKTA